MNFIWIFLGIAIHLFFMFSALKFISKSMQYKNVTTIVIILLSLLNTFLPVFTHTIKIPYYSLHIPLLILYFIEFLYLSKFNFRSSLFIASSLTLNILSLHALVLIIFSAISQNTLLDIYNNDILFLQTLILNSILLILSFYILNKHFSQRDIKKIANTKIYSDIMSCISILFIIFLAYDSFIVMNNSVSFAFILSSISTVLFILILFYALFYFTYSFSSMHKFKRKADEIKFIKKEVEKKKLETEFKLYSDDLTKLYNRRFIFSKLDEVCKKNDIKFGLVFLDLASLKYVNDNFGHKIGDEYIIDIANILTDSIRDGDLSARIGGDEFLLILFDINEDDMAIVINRIKNTISSFNKRKPFIFHANIGYMCFDTTLDNHSSSEMLKKVDELMNIDKELFYKKSEGSV